MQGNLSQISFSDILLLTIGRKKTGLLRLTRGKETVEIYLNHGDIVHATCPIGEGEKALLYPVTWDHGTFAMLPNGSAPSQTIQKQSAELLEEIKSMSQEWEQILQVIPTGKKVFRIADLGEDHQGPVTVPHVGWRVLCKINGTRNVEQLAELLRVPYAYIAKVIYNLFHSGLIETVPGGEPADPETVPPEFFTRMISVLTEAIGPMAPLVVQDQISSLNESPETFPEEKLEDLVEAISQEIPDEKMRRRFQQMMLQEFPPLDKF